MTFKQGESPEELLIVRVANGYALNHPGWPRREGEVFRSLEGLLLRVEQIYRPAELE